MPKFDPAARAAFIPPGLVARAGEAVRYVVSGVAAATWFGPLEPMKPLAPESVRGRAFDYPVGYNLRVTPRVDEAVSFSLLHALADGCDMLRIVIETRKDQIEGQDWDIRPKKRSDGSHPPASAVASEIAAAQTFFAFPDRERDLCSWIRTIAEEMFVTDAVSIYLRPDRRNGIHGFEILDGATIAPRIDAYGRTPKAPDVAYQQILRGVPAPDFSRDELAYFPRTQRPGPVCGAALGPPHAPGRSSTTLAAPSASSPPGSAGARARWCRSRTARSTPRPRLPSMSPTSPPASAPSTRSAPPAAWPRWRERAPPLTRT